MDVIGAKEIAWFLACIICAATASLFGIFLGSKDKVKEDTCHERRKACDHAFQIQLDVLAHGIGKANDKLDRLIEGDH